MLEQAMSTFRSWAAGGEAVTVWCFQKVFEQNHNTIFIKL